MTVEMRCGRCGGSFDSTEPARQGGSRAHRASRRGSHRANRRESIVKTSGDGRENVRRTSGDHRETFRKPSGVGDPAALASTPTPPPTPHPHLIHHPETIPTSICVSFQFPSSPSLFPYSILSFPSHSIMNIEIKRNYVDEKSLPIQFDPALQNWSLIIESVPLFSCYCGALLVDGNFQMDSIQ